MTKEQVYDEKLAPLMAQIIDICRESKIAFVADFLIPNDEDDSLHCTSFIVEDEAKPDDVLLRAVEILKPRKRPSPLMLTTTHADGSKTITAIMG